MSRKIMTTKPFPRHNRIIPVGSYMNVDKKLYDDLVLRKRVAVSMARYKEMKSQEEQAEVDKYVDEIETTAERIAEAEKAESVQHVVVHHYDGSEEE